MDIHKYDGDTGEFICTNQARTLPGRETYDEADITRYQIPALCTTTAPPSVSSNQVATWSGETWNVVADHRGEVWYSGYQEPVNIDFLGDPAERGLLQTEPDPPVTPPKELIERERERRLSNGFYYTFPDERGRHLLATSATDMQGWQDCTNRAQALLMAEDFETTFTIYTETGKAAVTANEWNVINLALSAYRQALWDDSDELIGMDPIPDDYDSDTHWTTQS